MKMNSTCFGSQIVAVKLCPDVDFTGVHEPSKLTSSFSSASGREGWGQRTKETPEKRNLR